MSNRKNVIDDKELLGRLENDRKQDVDNGNGSSSLQRIVNDDISNSLSLTKLLPMLVTIVGGMYVAVTQIYAFTTSIDSVTETSQQNTETITQLSEHHTESRNQLEELIINSTDSLSDRVENIEKNIHDIEAQYDRKFRNLESGVEGLENTIQSSREQTQSTIGGLRSELNTISSRVSEIETEIRIIKIENRYNNSDKSSE